ncbi:MAG: phage portal protein [Luteolibacter sp.]
MTLFGKISSSFAAVSQVLRGESATAAVPAVETREIDAAGTEGKSLGGMAAWLSNWDGGAASAGDLAKPYARSAWVRSAIGFVAAPISMRPLIFSRDRRGGDQVIEDPELTKFWERPARNAGGKMNRQDFIEATVALLKLRGQCFWLLDPTWEIRGAGKNPLILASAESMHAIIDGGELVGWNYRGARGSNFQFIPANVIHHKFWNPYDEVVGLSEWEAAQISAEADYAAGVFAKNLAKNNGDRGPYVIGKSGQFTDDQVKQISAQLKAKRELGRKGDFRAAFIPADVDVKDPSVESVDASYVAQRLENRKEVYIAFGVPPSFADPQASYSIGSASDRFRLIEDTCMPLAAKIADGMEIVSARFLDTLDTIFVEFDWDSHSTMQAIRAERFDTAVKAVDKGMPWKVAGEYFRLKFPRFAGDDVGRIPFNLTEITADPKPEPANAPAAVKSDPFGDLQRLFSLAPVTRIPAVPARKDFNPATAAKWAQIHKAREPWEKKFQSKVSRYLMDARAETLRNIATLAGQHPDTAKMVMKDLTALSLVFDLGKFLEAWTKGLLGISAAAMEAAGLEVWTDELLRDDPLTMPAAEVLRALSERENRISGAGQQVWEQIVTSLQDGITKGETTDQMAERIRTKFSSIDKQRSIVIAKTETTVAYETARNLAFHAAGVQWKQWLTSGLGNSRHDHASADEQIVPVDEPFIVGGFEMLFPGDPNAPAKEVINCNCVSIAVAGPNSDDINNDPTVPY